ncbi:MAG: hypothetical protein HZB38_11030 [Planctomycetes bacterium]|nr:hypothetical protein [Planctomycetota bacterium]
MAPGNGTILASAGAAAFFGILLLLAGGLLIKAAWFPRRRGETPFCQKCRYNLTGLELTSDLPPKCPECGTPLQARNVLRGERVRRRGLALVGVLLVTLGISGFSYWLADRIKLADWYEWAPGDLVITLLTSSNTQVATDAAAETNRRMHLRRFWPWQRARLARLCLNVQSQRQSVMVSPSAFIEWLGTLASRNELTQEQQDEFARNCLAVKVEARRQAIVDQGCPMRFILEWRGPSNGVKGVVELVKLEADGRALPQDGLEIDKRHRLGAREIIDWPAPANAPGPHTIVVEFAMEVQTRSLGASASITQYSETRRFVLPVEVLAEPPAGAIRIVPTDEFQKLERSPVGQSVTAAMQNPFLPGGAFQQSNPNGPAPDDGAELRNPENRVPDVTVMGVHVRSTGDRAGAIADLGVRFPTGEPVGFAFDVYLAEGESERYVGWVARPWETQQQPTYYIEWPLPGPVPETMDVVLRPSAAAAMRTFDLDRIYGGVLRFDDVVVMSRD